MSGAELRRPSAGNGGGEHSAGRALRGRRILLTRAEEDCAAWAEALERDGAVPVLLPCIAAAPLDSPRLASTLKEAAANADWIVFTSRRGVEAFARVAGSGCAAHARTAVVGDATADAAAALLGRVDLTGEGGTARSLADALLAVFAGPAAVPDLNNGRNAGHERSQSSSPAPKAPETSRRSSPAPKVEVVLALAENAGDTLERALAAAGVACRRFDLYRTVPAPPREPKLRLEDLGVDAVFLASPSAVTGFANQVDVDASATLVAIGPSTAAAIRALGLEVAGEARTPSLAGLLEAMP